jgi:hypothetical protein
MRLKFNEGNSKLSIFMSCVLIFHCRTLLRISSELEPEVLRGFTMRDADTNADDINVE